MNMGRIGSSGPAGTTVPKADSLWNEEVEFMILPAQIATLNNRVSALDGMAGTAWMPSCTSRPVEDLMNGY
jgi:hypothetical protein